MNEIHDDYVNEFLKCANHYFDGLHIEETSRGTFSRAFEAKLNTPYADASNWSPTCAFTDGVKSLVEKCIGQYLSVSVQFNNTGTCFWVTKTWEAYKARL